MIDQLEALGFSDLIKLRPENRDGLRRMAWSGVLQGQLWMILLVETGGKWFLDKIQNGKDDNDELMARYLTQPDPVDTVLLMIRQSQYGR